MQTATVQKFIVRERKGASYRLIDIQDQKEYRLHHQDAQDITVGSLLTAKLETYGRLITSIEVIDEVVGDSTKARVEVCLDEVKLGDLIDGVPILNFGTSYAKKGKKMAYAYFKFR